MPHFQSHPTPDWSMIEGFANAMTLAAVKQFKRRYFELPQMYITLYNDPTLPPEETARLAHEWAEQQFQKEIQA